MIRHRLVIWAPGVAAGLLVLVVGLWEVGRVDVRTPAPTDTMTLFVLVLAVAVAAYRVLPSLSLVLLWLLAFLQLWDGVPILIVELAMALIAYGCARYGSVATVAVSAVSAPAIALIAHMTVRSGRYVWLAHNRLYDILGDSAIRHAAYGSALLIGVALLLVPWLVGLLLRVVNREARTRAEQVETARERDRVTELADLREGQARLARDVHDVVGHSLAVILAQAESAQYLPDDDPAKLKTTLATIAASARSSLQDVRQVLGATTESRPPDGGLESLIDGVRSSGHEVLSSEIGDPRPLPPELATVAYRVLQEMLTNAIRHGRRDEPVRVERHWQDELRIEVSNVIDTASQDTAPLRAPGEAAPAPGNGLTGMRRRLESVGGRLDVRPRTGGDDPASLPTFTVTAWLPTGVR